MPAVYCNLRLRSWDFQGSLGRPAIRHSRKSCFLKILGEQYILKVKSAQMSPSAYGIWRHFPYAFLHAYGKWRQIPYAWTIIDFINNKFNNKFNYKYFCSGHTFKIRELLQTFQDNYKLFNIRDLGISGSVTPEVVQTKFGHVRSSWSDGDICLNKGAKIGLRVRHETSV